MKTSQNFFRQSLTFLAFAIAAFNFVSTVNAQSSGVDPSFNTVPANGIASLGDFALQPDGKILTFSFGETRIFNGVPKNRIARLNADGSLDNSFDCAACDLNITSVIVQADGKIVVAGSSNSSGFTAAKIRRLNPDGSIDNSLVSPFAEGNFTTSSAAGVVAVQPDGKILVAFGGFFSGFSQTLIYRLNPNGTFDASFTTIAFSGGRFSSQYVTQVRLQTDGKILASGGNSGFQSFGFLYRFNSDGTRDTTFESPTLTSVNGSASTIINDFDVRSDGSVVIGGRFDTVNSVSRVNFARLLPAGNVDLSFAPTNFFAFGEPVLRVKILSDGRILVSTATRLLRFNSDGTLDGTFNAPNNFTQISRWVVDAQGRIIINASVLENGVTVSRTLRLNPNGSLDVVLNINAALTGTVSILAVQPDGKVIFGGDFTTVNNVPRGNFARVNADGSLDATFNPGTGFNTVPLEIVVQPDGKILVGGGFSSYNGTARNGIVRLNADGSLDGGFAPVITPGSSVNAIALQPNGKIFIGGNFAAVNAQTRSGIALLNADGTLDATFNPTIGNNGATINDIFVQPDGKILVGGLFSGINGFNRVNLVRFNADGTLDNSFNAGNIGEIKQIQIQADGKYVALTGSSLIRLNANGTTDATFQSPALAVNAFLIQSDGKIIIGGNFPIPSGSGRPNIVRLRADGTVDAPFIPGGANGEVRALAFQADGKILVGGAFSVIGNVTRVGIARLNVASITPATPFDFDGDGRADVSVFRPSNGTWYTSQNPAINYGAFTFGIASDKLAPADYDGDGVTDIAVYRPSNGVWYLQRSRDGFVGIALGDANDVPVPADYDGDGKADIAVFRPSNGTWYILRSTQGLTAVAFGLGTDKPVPADYDGDGRANIAVFRPSNGTWYTSQNPAINYGATLFGVAEDRPVPADYDGDGKADLAVFRPSNGVWYLNRSQNGFTGIAFGFGTDVPVPADYDGDGKTDVGVFRNGSWYLQRSTSGYTGIAFGAATDRPVPNAFVR